MSVFPGSLDSDATLYVAKDYIQTKLNAPMGISDTVVVVVSPTGWAANMVATVELEQMLVTNVAGNLITVTRAFNGTTGAAHAAGKTFSNFVDAIYQSSAKSAIIAIETALGVNLINVSGPEVLARNYDFPFFAPAENLSPTLRVVTFSTTPLGVNGGDTSHYLGIYDNAGALQETVLINGGTAVAGGSGFITFASISGTYASGSYKIGTATGGIAEARQSISSGGGIGTILITEYVTMYAGVYATAISERITFVGQGRESNLVKRAQSYTAGDLFHDSVAAPWYMRDLGIVNGLPTPGAMTGSAVYVGPGGQIQMESVGIVNGQYGIRLIGVGSTTLHNVTYVNVDMSFKAQAGLQLEGLCVNVFISDCLFVGAPVSNANVLSCGIRFFACDGVWISNTLVSADVGYAFNPQSDYLANIRVVGGGADSVRQFAVIFTGAGFPIINIRFIGGHYHAQSNGTTTGTGPVIYVDPSAGLDEISFDGCFIAGGAIEGVQLLATGMKEFGLRNTTIADNNVSNTASKAAILTANGATGLQVVGCRIGNLIGGHQKYAIAAAGTLSANITGNDLQTNETAPLNLGTFSGIIENNQGLSDVIGTAASGASVALPTNSIITITGTTGVGAVTGLWEGRRVTLITTDGTVTFTAGATLGDTITSIQNRPLLGVVSSGKLYLS